MKQFSAKWLLAAILALAGTTLACAQAAGPSNAPSANSPSDQTSIVVNRSTSTWCDWVAETPNFRISWCPPTGDVRKFAAKCERLAALSKECWLGKESRPWAPKCEVIVHRGTAEYVACLGPGSQATSGCATIQLDQGHVVGRRIDLRVDAADWMSESLPHELMHVVLADRFSTRRIPPWADEGIAMLSESPAKIERRLIDLRRAAAQGTIYNASNLMSIQSDPGQASRPAFYGQSLALVSVLLEWGTREDLLKFVALCQQNGTDAALREVYGSRTATDLERQFARQSASEKPFALAHQTLVAETGSSKDARLAQ